MGKNIESIVDALTSDCERIATTDSPADKRSSRKGPRTAVEKAAVPDHRTKSPGTGLSPAEIRNSRRSAKKDKQIIVRTYDATYQKWMERYQRDGDMSFNAWVERIINDYVDDEQK